MTTAPMDYDRPVATSAGQTVRRIIVYTLLFALVVITATGLSGLLGLLLDAGTTFVGDTTSILAQALAFTLVGGPLAAVLWWVVWRRLAEPAERSSLAWSLYISAMFLVALISFTTSLLSTASSLVDGDWYGPTLAGGFVWAAVWIAHRWMWRHPAKGPVHLVAVPAVLGAAFGLVLGVSGAIGALTFLFDAAISGVSAAASVGSPWWIGALQAAVWAVGGGAVWAWHWYREGARSTSSGLANVLLVVVGILGGSLLTLGGIGTAVFVALRVLFDNSDTMTELLAPLPVAIAAAGVGALVWVYHRGIAENRSPATRNASMLATSGVALVAAATGIGVIVNSALGILTEPLAGEDTRTLLLAGISALLVGGPVWWLTWRPLSPTDATALTTGRRIYLIAVFGLSAIVALVTLLVIGFRLFEFVLSGEADLVERVRAPLGLLVATALVAGYHFSVWRSDRASAEASAPPPRLRTVGEVILVTGADPAPLVQVIESVTGASVTVWRTAVAAAPAPTALDQTLTGAVAQGPLPVPPSIADLPAATYSPAPAGAAPTMAPLSVDTLEPVDPEQLAHALDGVAGRRVLIVAGPGRRLDVLALAD